MSGTVYIKDNTGKTKTVMIHNFSMSIKELVEEYARVAEIGEGTVQLVYQGKTLDPTHNMDQYGIRNFSTLHCVVRVSGGSCTIKFKVTNIFIQYLK